MKTKPDYRKIYTDLIRFKFPDKMGLCTHILNKAQLGNLDIITLNKILFQINNEDVNQKLKSYDRQSIFEILDYQKKHNLNNSQTARHFKLSRNTIAKWKKVFF